MTAAHPAPAAPDETSGPAGADPRRVPLLAVALLQPDHPCLPAEPPADDEES